jgi:hypothetical protein
MPRDKKMETSSINNRPDPSPEPLLQPSETVLANTAFVSRSRVVAREYVPRMPLFGDEDSEIDFYARSPFTAWEHALLRSRHHPKLWRAIKGTPFEGLYRERFAGEFTP